MNGQNHKESCVIVLNDFVCIILPLNKATKYHVPEVLIYLAWNSAVVGDSLCSQGIRPRGSWPDTDADSPAPGILPDPRGSRGVLGPSPPGSSLPRH